MNAIDHQIFTVGEFPENDLVKLMEHIASGAPDVWAVYASNGYSKQHETFDEANADFERFADNEDVYLVLYTRIGTSVIFRGKGAYSA